MRRINDSIEYQKTGKFHINELPEIYNYDWFKEGKEEWITAIHLSAYHICKVYTDKGTPFYAYLKLNGSTATKQIIFDNNARVDQEKEQLIISQILYNDSFNCHGYTFLDGMFWFDLNKETVKILLKEDRYTECKQTALRGNGVLLFYDSNEELIHSAKKFRVNSTTFQTDKNLNDLVVSKFGINQVLTRSEEEIYERYKTVDRTKTRYYNKSFRD